MAVPAHVPRQRLTGLGRIIRWWRRAPTRWWFEKRHSSAFHDTDLQSAALAMAGIDRLGHHRPCRTEMCVDSACRGAVALDYRVALVADAHTTLRHADASCRPHHRPPQSLAWPRLRRLGRRPGRCVFRSSHDRPDRPRSHQRPCRAGQARPCRAAAFGNMPARGCPQGRKGRPHLGRGGPRICRLSPGLRPRCSWATPIPT